MRRHLVGLVAVALAAGCVAAGSEPVDRAATDGGTSLSGSFDLVLRQLSAHADGHGAVMGLPPPSVNCVQLVSEGATTVLGDAVASWEPEAPTTRTLRLGLLDWDEGGPTLVAESIGASSLRVAFADATVGADEELIVFLSLPADTSASVAVNQAVRLDIDIAYTGDALSFWPTSCAIGSV